MLNKEHIAQLVQDYLQNTDFSLLELTVSPNGAIHICIDSLHGVSMEDCVKLNRYVESKLDREVQDFELEVSSYSISLPFKVPLHYQKNIGRTVEITLVEAGKKIKGVLQKVQGDTIEIVHAEKKQVADKKRKELVAQTLVLNINDIKQTKLVFEF